MSTSSITETPDVDIDVATMDFRDHACPALSGHDGLDRGPPAPLPLKTVVWINSGGVSLASGYGGALEEPASLS